LDDGGIRSWSILGGWPRLFAEGEAATLFGGHRREIVLVLGATNGIVMESFRNCHYMYDFG